LAKNGSNAFDFLIFGVFLIILIIFRIEYLSFVSNMGALWITFGSITMVGVLTLVLNFCGACNSIKFFIVKKRSFSDKIGLIFMGII